MANLQHSYYPQLSFVKILSSYFTTHPDELKNVRDKIPFLAYSEKGQPLSLVLPLGKEFLYTRKTRKGKDIMIKSEIASNIFLKSPYLLFSGIFKF